MSRSPKSFLLLGPRQVGKSTLVSQLKPDLAINLADEQELYTFSSNPGELRMRLETHQPRSVFLDEIQRLPNLLNTIQSMMDQKHSPRFFLTGSSARKLRRGGANLLPGRVLNFYLGPLVAAELDHQAHTQQALRFGFLPEIYLGHSTSLRTQLLRSYAVSYLAEEIKAEALTRNLEAFARFLNAAIQQAGLFLDYSKWAKRARISRHAFARFYEILEDTLVGTRVWPFETLLEQADLVKHPKFYVFDNGVFNGVLNCFDASADRIGILAEQLIFNQLVHSAWARGKEMKISTFRTRGGLEIDFVLEYEGKVFGLEVKTSANLLASDVAPLRAFKKYCPRASGIMVFHLGDHKKKVDGVWCYPWQEGLQELGI